MGLIARLRKALAERKKKQEELRRKRERQEAEAREKDKAAEEAAAKRNELLLQLDGETDPDRRATLIARIREYHDKAKARRHQADHANERARVLAEKIKFGVKRVTVLRKKIKEAKKQKHPKFEPWMANGHEYWNLTEVAKSALAVAVVHYGLTCTSITRNWGTGSFHEQVPTRGFDCAGARMVEFQIALYNGNILDIQMGDILELFGPSNVHCIDNGRPAPQAEGSPNETLHDTHDHCFFLRA